VAAARCLAIHPGSGSESKNWPEARWAELLSVLAAELDWNLLLVGGEAEGDRLDRLADRWPAQRLEIARSLPLVQLAQRLSSCQLFLGHDSGITHLAAALGLPGLVLWGESPFAVWRPRHAAMECLRAGNRLALLEVAEVWGALAARLR
jgi:ADP-heptose:LPS heptosyltransferase